MEKLIDSSLALTLDRISQEEYLIPSLSLMENAAMCLYHRLKAEISKASSVLFVAGGGNNGGDAIALARICYCNGLRNLSLYLAEGRETKERERQRLIARKLGIPTQNDFKAELIIEGLYGAGLKGPLRPEGRALIEKINNEKTRVISIDVPAGLSPEAEREAVVKAEATLTFGYAKREMYVSPFRALCGKIEVLNPSFAPAQIEASAFKFSPEEYKKPSRESGEYKNTRGHVAVLGGSASYSGAVTLASLAAFKAGAGLVTIYTDPKLAPNLAFEHPSFIVRTFEDLVSLDSYDSVLIGPGFGLDASRTEILEKALSLATSPVVIDADAIRLYRPEFKTKAPLVFTPHLGEFKALSGKGYNTPRQFFENLSSQKDTIVCKSDVVWIQKLGETPVVIDGSNPALGVAGSGDVLSGVIAAYLAQGRTILSAALLHQEAGALASKEKGMFSADELLEYIGRLSF